MYPVGFGCPETPPGHDVFNLHRLEPEAKRKKLGDLRRTRCVQRLDALHTFPEMHLSVVTCLESICEWGPGKWSADSLRDAIGLLLAITAFDFISALIVTNKCLGYLRALTCSLQAEAKDVMQAVGGIDVVLTSLKEARNAIDQQHDAWLQEIELMCRSVDAVPSIPRRCAKQRHGNNVPADDPRTYYRHSISVPLVDHLLVELETRFSPHHRVALIGLCLVPSTLVTLPDPGVTLKGHLAKLVDLYEEDLASPESVSRQMISWQSKWQQQMEQHGKACLPTYRRKHYRTRHVCTQICGYCCWCSAHCRSHVVRVRDHLALWSESKYTWDPRVVMRISHPWR